MFECQLVVIHPDSVSTSLKYTKTKSSCTFLEPIISILIVCFSKIKYLNEVSTLALICNIVHEK